jgi:hypothetical protein
MLSLLLAALVLFPFSLEEAKPLSEQRGIVSLYRPWQKSSTVPYARYPGAWRTKPQKDDLVCAHRWIPYGTYLRISTKKQPGNFAYCVVLDRGPYGACIKTGDRKKYVGCKRGHKYKVIVQKYKPKNGYYRAIVDATPAVHRMMEGDGWQHGTIERLDIPRNREPLRVGDLRKLSLLSSGLRPSR